MANLFYNSDIDLEKIDETQDPKELVNVFGTLVDADSDQKIFPARQWVENFLYFAGVRDMNSRLSSGTVTGNSLLSSFQGASTGQGNLSRRRISKTFKACQIQASNVTRQKPSTKVWAESDNEVAVKKAKLSNILLDYYWDEDHEEDINYEAVLWALLTPLVARKDYLDFEFNKGRLWPKMSPVIGPDGGQAIGPDGKPMMQPIVDQNGNPIVEQHPWNKSELVSAFRLIFNPMAAWRGDIDYCGDYSVKRFNWIVQNFDKTEEGYHPENVAQLKKGIWKQTSTMALENALKQLTFGTFRSYRNFNYSNPVMKDGVTYLNFYLKPTANYPEGREICIANALLLYDGPSRCYRDMPFNWHPYSFLCYERVPGRMWGTSYAEKITDINRAYEQARTEWDQLRRTFSKPKLALPIGAQIDRDTITGDEQVWRYNPFGPDGGKPHYLNAPQPPSTILDDIKMTQSEFVEISGVTEIMQGIRPQGVSTFRGLEVLREEATNSQNNWIRMNENFIQTSQTNKLYNMKAALKYHDPSLVNAVKMFKKMNHNLTDIDIVEFTGDSLGGYVKIEPYSSIGKSKLALQEKFMSLGQMGVLGDIVNDPDLNEEYKRKMDVSGFERPQNKQVIYARYENQIMLSAQEKGMPLNPPVMPWHDPVLHIREVDQLLLDPTLQDKPLIMKSLIAHRDAHMAQLAEQQAKAAMQQAQMGAQGEGPSAPQEAAKQNGLQPPPKQDLLFAPDSGGAQGMDAG
jgi:hypothetical protein